MTYFIFNKCAPPSEMTPVFLSFTNPVQQMDDHWKAGSSRSHWEQGIEDDTESFDPEKSSVIFETILWFYFTLWFSDLRLSKN
jgi:hypothetical protein